MKRFVPFITILLALSIVLAITVSSNLLGDIDGDGIIKAADARRILRYAAELETLTPRECRAADINSDGKITAVDARLILLSCADIEELTTYDSKTINTYSNDFCVEVQVDHADGSSSQGSGFFISEDGIVVTNYHVISEADSIRVLTYDMQWHDVYEILAFDAKKDLAVMRADCTCPYYADLQENLPIVDSTIYALGSPNGESFTFSEGKILETNHYLEESSYIDFIVFDAATAPGSSGCPIIDSNGVVVGINAREELLDEGEQNYAIPVSDLLALEYLERPLSVTEFMMIDSYGSGLSRQFNYYFDEYNAIDLLDVDGITLNGDDKLTVTFRVKDYDNISLSYDSTWDLNAEWGNWYQDGTMIDLTIWKDNDYFTDGIGSYIEVYISEYPDESIYVPVSFN